MLLRKDCQVTTRVHTRPMSAHTLAEYPRSVTNEAGNGHGVRKVWSGRNRRAASRQIRGQTRYEGVYRCGGRSQSTPCEIERNRAIEVLHQYR